MRTPSALLFGLLAALPPVVAAHPNTVAGSPHPVRNPASRVMLAVPGLPADSHAIDFARLPRLPVEHVVVSDVRARPGAPVPSGRLEKDVGGVNQHNYIIHHAGRYWAMWSDGPRIEDMVGQVVKFATSADGRRWEAPRFLTGYPPGSGPGSPHYNTRRKEGLRYIARGFWVREGELLALASLDEAAGFFGPSLELRAWRWNAGADRWDDAGVVQKDAINNFPPQRLPTGEWAMTRRKHDYNRTGVELLIGGVRALNDWTSVPVVSGAGGDVALKAEEPIWWALPDGNLVALFRDNAKSGYVFRAFSSDAGRTWSRPVATDFPDARSKLHGCRLRDGRYVLVSNANPAGRDPLTLAVSRDGLVFDQLFYLVGGRHVDYPHVYEHAGHLYVAHSGGKQSVEIQRVRIADLGGAGGG